MPSTRIDPAILQSVDQNLPARLRAASAAEMRERPLAVPEAPELSVPNGFGRALFAPERSRNIDCVPAPAEKPAANGLL